MTKEDKIKEIIEDFEEKTRELLKGIEEEKSPWISVNDKLPKNRDIVICLTKKTTYQDIVTVCLYDGDYQDFSPLDLPRDLSIKVHYWMPIPKSPEEQ